mmetsp:Transcript_117543/g.312689  ORF Transcript_117543/g.312689 Transcript_117543/m.312689 type:complete len:282 (+) Transcript_117543:632-1477(+)
MVGTTPACCGHGGARLDQGQYSWGLQLHRRHGSAPCGRSSQLHQGWCFTGQRGASCGGGGGSRCACSGALGVYRRHHSTGGRRSDFRIRLHLPRVAVEVPCAGSIVHPVAPDELLWRCSLADHSHGAHGGLRCPSTGPVDGGHCCGRPDKFFRQYHSGLCSSHHEGCRDSSNGAPGASILFFAWVDLARPDLVVGHCGQGCARRQHTEAAGLHRERPHRRHGHRALHGDPDRHPGLRVCRRHRVRHPAAAPAQHRELRGGQVLLTPRGKEGHEERGQAFDA